MKLIKTQRAYSDVGIRSAMRYVPRPRYRTTFRRQMLVMAIILTTVSVAAFVVVMMGGSR